MSVHVKLVFPSLEWLLLGPCYCHVIVAHISVGSVHMLIWPIGLGRVEQGEVLRVTEDQAK